MLSLRFLGEIEVWRDGERLALPPSRKTRALLAYLAVTGRQHRRERLCTLLWEIPDDPRGALRWSLSRLRALVDEENRQRIVATRETVGFEPAGATIDLALLRRHGKELARLSTDALAELAAQFRGTFLEGLDLPDLHDFQAWCLAEREDVRGLQARILSALNERLADDPAAALPHARQLVQIDPYNPGARAALVRHLMALGRRSEAEQHFEAGTRVLKEVGEGAEIVLLKTWRALRERQRPAESPKDRALVRQPDTALPAAVETSVNVPPKGEDDGAPPLIGRDAELGRLIGLIDTVGSRLATRVGLIAGEPGLGKTRLAEEVVDRARARGVPSFVGRAYEIDRNRPYGVWSDALDMMPLIETVPTADTAKLLRQEGAPSPAAVRDRFFAAVGVRLAAGGGPSLLVLDDVQWCDDASAALLHHLVRSGRLKNLTVILVARNGELPDNPAILGVLRSLRHDRLLDEIVLAPLSHGDAGRLVKAVAPATDSDRLAVRSGGNPLLAIELARSARDGDEAISRSLKEIVRDRIDRLPAHAAELLRWASVLGADVPVRRLAQVAQVDSDAMVAALDILERHALLRAVPEAGDGIAYRFAHDLVRQAIYTGLSEPRRRLMHHKVAGILGEAGIGDEALATEVAHHAVLGGDAGMAAAAFASAARRCLRLHANAEAAALARRGLSHAGDLPEPERLKRTIELVNIELHARRPADLGGLIRRLEALAERALDHDCPDDARRVFHMLSDLRWERGFWAEAEHDTLRAEAVSRKADPAQRVVAMAETARCLAMLERDLPQADSLVLEASALAKRLNVEPNALADAGGLLSAHRGEFDEAAAFFRRARIVAQRDGERTSEFLALEHLIEIELARKRHIEAEALAAEMIRVAARLRAGSEAPFARTLDAICRAARGDAAADPDFEAAIEALRAADAKHRLSLALRAAAEIDLADGKLERARQRGEEALAFAQAIDRPSDIVHARALLAEIAGALGDGRQRGEQIDALRRETARPISLHARALAEALTVPAASAERPRPTRRAAGGGRGPG